MPIDRKAIEIAKQLALEQIKSINPYASYLNDSTISNIPGYINTGSMPLNAIISGSLYGGIPRNRVTLLAGESMTGKSFLLMQTLANAQKEGQVPVIFDPEFAIDNQSARSVGLDPADVVYVPSFSIEQARNSIYKFLTEAREKGIENRYVVACELGNFESELGIKRMDNEKTSADMGSRAKAMGSLLRICNILSGYAKATFIITNHIYDDPSAMYDSIIKNMPGGKKMWYIPSVSVQLGRKPEKSDEGKTMDAELVSAQRNFPGVIMRALTVKNRFIQQYLQAEMYLSFTTGLDKYYGLLDLATGFGSVICTGSTYQLPNGEKLGYYKNWRKDEAVWNKILPDLEQKLKTKWSYSDKSLIEEDIPDESAELPKLVEKKLDISKEIAEIKG